MVGQWDGSPITSGVLYRRSTVSPPAVFAETLPAHCNTGLARTSIKCRKMTNPTFVNMDESCAYTYAQIHGVVTCIRISYNTTCLYIYICIHIIIYIYILYYNMPHIFTYYMLSIEIIYIYRHVCNACNYGGSRSHASHDLRGCFEKRTIPYEGTEWSRRVAPNGGF
jgi:hypothetical protein